MAQRALLKVTATSAVALALLTSGTLAYSQCLKTPEPSSPETQDVDSILRIAVAAWRGNDYLLARTAERQLADSALRTELEQLVLFGEARVAIQHNDFTSASRIAQNLAPGAKRALIFTALARQRTAAAAARSNWLHTALRDARTLGGKPQAYLVDVILPVAFDVDATQAVHLLDRAIHENGGTDPNSPNVHREGTATILATGSQLVEVVHGYHSTEVFVLGVPGLIPADVRDLAIAHHGELRCMYSSGHEHRAARHHSPVVHGG